MNSRGRKYPGAPCFQVSTERIRAMFYAVPRRFYELVAGSAFANASRNTSGAFQLIATSFIEYAP